MNEHNKQHQSFLEMKGKARSVEELERGLQKLVISQKTEQTQPDDMTAFQKLVSYSIQASFTILFCILLHLNKI